MDAFPILDFLFTGLFFFFYIAARSSLSQLRRNKGAMTYNFQVNLHASGNPRIFSERQRRGSRKQGKTVTPPSRIVHGHITIPSRIESRIVHRPCTQ
jgi:hypothetical protein